MLNQTPVNFMYLERIKLIYFLMNIKKTKNKTHFKKCFSLLTFKVYFY